MFERIRIKHLKDKPEEDTLGKNFTICGWIRTARHQKTFSFIEINDGSTLSNFQVIADGTLESDNFKLSNLSVGTSVCIEGTIVESPGNKQKYEMKGEKITILGACDDTFPLQKKRHSFEFLRTIAHLRPRTNTQGAVARVRSRLAFATHQFFQKNDFLYLQSPIITASDCEGAGELFQVTTLNLEKLPKKEDRTIDYQSDFFQKQAYLTVSGQLNAETFACALSDVYTFGPTFRAENSNTSRHLAEFWMIEPELAFSDIHDLKNLSENFVKAITKDILENCQEDMKFFDQFIEKGLIERLEKVVNSDFARLTYTEVIEILKKSGKKFEFPYSWGCDLQSEHERYIAEEHCKKPVIITDYPSQIKAFYMRDNDDNKTVAALDIVVPKIGEIVGGSQREERYDVLKAKIEKQNLDPSLYSWYLDLRKFGSVPHAGFGAGFERLVQFITGMENIRDVIAYPRIPGNADY